MSQLSYHAQNGNGGNTTFSIDTFSEDEIEVYVDGVLKTTGSSNDYTIPNYSSTGGTVTWVGTPPSSSNKIRIVRNTDLLNNGNTAVEGRATFQAGSSVKAEDLNNNTKQVLRSLQERQDQLIQRYDLEDGEVIRSKIAADAVDGTKIADDSVDSEHLVADSIDTEHYAANSVDATAIGPNAVTTVKILNDNVTMEKLGSGALPTDITVNTDNIVNGSITTNDIGADQITNALIADDQIDSEHYVDGSVDRQHLSADIIDSTKLADESVNSEHFVDGSIDREHLAADIVDGTKIADDAIGTEHIQADAVTDSEILTGTLDNRYFTETELNAGALDGRYYTETELDAGQLDNRYYTETELDNGALDGRYYTETESEARFLRQDSSETIASGVTWSASDAFVATTAAIDLRIIELVDNVGGFVPIDNETSFPTANPDINTSGSAKGGTIVSVKAASTNLTAQSGTTLTIANGRGTGNAVIITGVTATIPSGFGFLVETTATDHTYAFHRLVPKATEVATVAANAVNIAAAGANVVDINNFADLYQISTSAPTQRADSSSLQIGDLWFDSSSNKVLMIYDGSAGDGFTAATPNASDLVNINIVAGHITFQEDLGLITNAVNTGSGNNSVNTVATDISNVNTVAGSISNINAVAADNADIGAVAAKATEIGRLGTADAVADMNTLGTTAIVSDMDTLADISSNITTVAGISGNVTTVAGISSNVTTVAGNTTNINTVAGANSNVTAVAGKATEIGRLGTADAVADLAILGTTDVVADMNTLATSANVTAMDNCSDDIANINTVSGSIANVNTTAGAISNVNTVASNIANVNTVGGISANVTTVAGISANVTTVATNNANVTTVAGNISDVNNFKDLYQIASSNPSTDGSGNALAAGDLYFNTSQNELKIYTGSAWQGGVTATGNLASVNASNTFAANQTINGNLTISGTVDGVDIAAFKTSFDNLSTDIVNDSSPQLGAALDGQNNNLNNIGTIDGTNLQLDFGSIA